MKNKKEEKKWGGARKGSGRKKVKEKKSEIIATRWTVDEWVMIDRHKDKLGFKTSTAYIRDLVERDLKIWGAKKK